MEQKIHEVIVQSVQANGVHLLFDPFKGWGHEHHFFDTERQAREYIASKPDCRMEYNFRAWHPSFIARSHVIDHRARK